MDKPDQDRTRGGKAGSSSSNGVAHAGERPLRVKPKAQNGKNGHGNGQSPNALARQAGVSASANAAPGRDWSKTLFLPKTEFSMKAGLPQLEPKLLARWDKLGLYKKLRKAGKGREKFVLHDGPPYANGNIHIGTGLNKILKDAVVKSQQMLGRDANYVPGWDCHGLPIEWKVEEQYRARQKNKDDVPVNEFRRECREFAEEWIGVQRTEFERLGVTGDWDNYYSTMAFEAEAVIAGELMKFALNGLLYRGSKPVMWSVVESTALAEAEIEYHEVTSPAVWVKFPILALGPDGGLVPQNQSAKRRNAELSNFMDALRGSSAVIWTTTPWTLPANRAVSFSQKVAYGLYEVLEAPADNWTKKGERLLLAVKLADNFAANARVKLRLVYDLSDPSLSFDFELYSCRHPLHEHGYDFTVPLLHGDHVSDETGTGFVHTAPGHGADDFEVWTANTRALQDRRIDTAVPDTVGPDGFYRADVPLFGGSNPKRVIDEKGSSGKLDDMAYANAAVIAALKQAGMLAAMNPRYKHDYPHSWRSKTPVIFRNTPQWFIALDKVLPGKGPLDKASGETKTNTLRHRALAAIDETRFVPGAGRNRLRGMIEARPDWVISRQRAWGVPITVFVHRETGEVIPNARFRGTKELIKRIMDAFKAEGADAWFAGNARERFLEGIADNPGDWEQVRDILDVWFDSGSTHAFVLGKRRDLKWPADLYLEGSDQHRGWFQSSLLQSCGTRCRAPYDAVLTHGFAMADDGRKMSKSLGNTVAPQDVIKQSGADILRLWALSSDYTEDLRIGKTILDSTVDAYRKLRNTLRYLLGNLAHYQPELAITHEEMPELERWVLHGLSVLDSEVRRAFADFDFKRAYRVMFEFCTNDLSAVYFDIRKDTLYCEPHSSLKRRAALTVLHHLFEHLCRWLAPVLPFTTEEAWLERHGLPKGGSVHLQLFDSIPLEWRDDALAAKWERVFAIRGVITGALEVERREKRIGSSLEAAPEIYVSGKALTSLAKTVDWAEIAITSAATVKSGKAPEGAFTLAAVEGVAVLPKRAEGLKCARSWRITKDVGLDAEYPDLSARDAVAVREYDLLAPRL